MTLLSMILRSACAAALASAAAPAFAQGAPSATESAEAAFYKGRQITLTIGNTAGTAYDASARLIARHFGRHIPGQPNIITQNMPGATGLIAANYVANIASQDGTVLANAHQSLPLRQVLGDPAVKYDARKLHWIGSADSSNNIFALWHTVPVDTIEQARTRPVIMGATTKAAASYIEVLLANTFLDTKFKAVLGYKGNDIDLAMERGEVEGRAGQSWAGFKATKPEWVRDKKVKVLTQLGVKPDPELPGVPLMQDMAGDAEGKQIIEVFAAQIALGRPVYAPAGVPAPRVATLRRAFEEMARSEPFLADAERMNLDVGLVTGTELAAIVDRMMATPPALAAKVKAMQE